MSFTYKSPVMHCGIVFAILGPQPYLTVHTLENSFIYNPAHVFWGEAHARVFWKEAMLSSAHTPLKVSIFPRVCCGGAGVVFGLGVRVSVCAS